MLEAERAGQPPQAKPIEPGETQLLQDATEEGHGPGDDRAASPLLPPAEQIGGCHHADH